MPGKTAAETIVTSQLSPASMGPRQDAGEDAIQEIKRPRIALELQWGPGRMPGKTVNCHFVVFVAAHLASMGPRQDAGEDTGHELACEQAQLASMGPRQDAGEDKFSAEEELSINALQWGPGRMPGKTVNGAQSESISAGASMGPRQDAGEDRSCGDDV